MSAIALLTDQHTYYLYEGRVDMRRSFDGLCGIVQNSMQRSLQEKDVYVFLNKGLTHIKLLLYEPDGFTLFYRRLHKGRFKLPATPMTNGAVQLSANELVCLLRGLHVYQLKNKVGYPQDLQPFVGADNS